MPSTSLAAKVVRELSYVGTYKALGSQLPLGAEGLLLDSAHLKLVGLTHLLGGDTQFLDSHVTTLGHLVLATIDLYFQKSCCLTIRVVS